MVSAFILYFIIKFEGETFYFCTLVPWHTLAEEHPEQPQPQPLSPLRAFLTCFVITNAINPKIIPPSIIVATMKYHSF